MNWIVSAALAGVFLLSGCSATGVTASSDPMVKIAQAEELWAGQGRYLPAKRLLDEALAIARERGNEVVEAEAFRGYGLFYAMPVRQNSMVPDDFVGKTNGIETRYLTAIEYFKRSAGLLEKHQQLARLSNVHFLISTTLAHAGDKAGACRALDDSQAAHKRAVAADPNLKVVLPRGVATFDQGIDKGRAELGCAKIGSLG